MAKIQIQNINQGGIADSAYVGGKNSVAEAVGLDIHSESGVIKVNNALVKDSGTVVDEFVKSMVSCTDGHTYHFSSQSGKIWQRSSGGVWSLVATAAPAAGSANILDAIESEGYIYYMMSNRVGRWQVGTAWSTRNDSWATFTVGDTGFHPARIVNGVVYIGDGYLVAQIDGGTFSANALDLETGRRIKALGKLNTDLLAGTVHPTNDPTCEVVRWNTWSVSYSYSDPIPEDGINCFLDTDNNVMVSAGSRGKIYLYNGAQLEEYKTLPTHNGQFYGNGAYSYVYPNATFNFHGLPLFGVSTFGSTYQVVNNGVWSLGRTNRSYPIVLNLEFPISTNNLKAVEIGAITPISLDRFLVSWKDVNTGTVVGVDLLSLGLKGTLAYFTTRVIMVDRTALTTFKTAAVAYKNLPANTSISIGKRLNNASTYTDISAKVTDTKRRMVQTKSDIGDAVQMQLKVSLVQNNGNAPEVEMLEIEV